MMQNHITNGKEIMLNEKEKAIIGTIADIIVRLSLLTLCFFTFGLLLTIHDILGFVFAFFVLLIMSTTP